MQFLNIFLLPNYSYQDCNDGIDDVAQHYLAKAGIAAVRRAKESDMTKLAKATGGRIVNNIDDLASADLGKASLVEERIVEGRRMNFRSTNFPKHELNSN